MHVNFIVLKGVSYSVFVNYKNRLKYNIPLTCKIFSRLQIHLKYNINNNHKSEKISLCSYVTKLYLELSQYICQYHMYLLKIICTPSKERHKMIIYFDSVLKWGNKFCYSRIKCGFVLNKWFYAILRKLMKIQHFCKDITFS